MLRVDSTWHRLRETDSSPAPLDAGDFEILICVYEQAEATSGWEPRKTTMKATLRFAAMDCRETECVHIGGNLYTYIFPCIHIRPTDISFDKHADSDSVDGGKEGQRPRGGNSKADRIRPLLLLWIGIPRRFIPIPLPRYSSLSLSPVTAFFIRAAREHLPPSLSFLCTRRRCNVCRL